MNNLIILSASTIEKIANAHIKYFTQALEWNSEELNTTDYANEGLVIWNRILLQCHDGKLSKSDCEEIYAVITSGEFDELLTEEELRNKCVLVIANYDPLSLRL